MLLYDNTKKNRERLFKLLIGEFINVKDTTNKMNTKRVYDFLFQSLTESWNEDDDMWAEATDKWGDLMYEHNMHWSQHTGGE